VLQQPNDRGLGRSRLEARGVDAEVILPRIDEGGVPADPVDLLLEEFGLQARIHQGPAEVAEGGAAGSGPRAERQSQQVPHPRNVLHLRH